MEVIDTYKLRIDNIISKYYGVYMNNSNIVGVGRGNKIINDKMSSTPSLTIFVKKKLSLGSIGLQYRIPKYINGVVTDVYESGGVKSLANEIRPAVGGISIGDSKKDGSGTLGYAVTDKKGERLYILSCAHVIAASNKIENPVQKILQPSLDYGGELRKSFIGVVDKIIPLRFGDTNIESNFNEVDAGRVYVGQNTPKSHKEILKPLLDPFLKVVITGTSTVKPGDKVFKVGQSSGITKGKVLTVNTIQKPYYEDAKDIVVLKNQIVTDVKAIGGDSGSIGIIENTTKAFGLLCAGHDTMGVFNNIDKVLEMLEVTIAKPIG